jgi:hypothetical protein
MKLTITFELPKDLTPEEIESFRESIGSAAVESIKNIFEYRGRDLAEEVAASMKVEEKPN